MSRPTDPTATRESTPAALALRDHILAAATRLGFHRVGIGPADAPTHYAAYQAWLDAEYHGSMAYMEAPDHVKGRAHPRNLSPTARTIVVVAMAYAKSGGDAAGAPHSEHGPRGFVARYARGDDYHKVMKGALYALADEVSQFVDAPVTARPCVDSAPLLEREFAARTGLGFIAKNTMLIVPGLGSYVLLGALLLDVEAAPTAVTSAATRCGSCRLCLDACPTAAFPRAHSLDARRCISYLTIEHRDAIPTELRAPMGVRVFGCDVCQEVCPFNKVAPDRTPPAPSLAPWSDDRGAPDLLALLGLGANQRRRYVDGSAMRRVNRVQLMRNVCVALGNAGDVRAVAPLGTILKGDASPVVRSHAAWALGRLGVRPPLERALARETDASVLAEISSAVAACAASADV